MKKNKTTWIRKHHWLLFVMTIFFFSAQAQEKLTISGNLKDSKSLPLVGVNVVVKGTNTGAITDFDGNYTIKAAKGEELVFSYLGFQDQSIIVGNQTTYNVVMIESTEELDQVVIVGYGTQRKKEVTGAVANVGADIISKAPVSDIGESLQGQVAGVNIQSSSGRPGSNANIQIRGVGSLIAGGGTPLYVVDGIPFQDNPNISPDQIESIDILKDGASAAVYGTRASNGVILITTKKGKGNKIKVDYNTYLAVQNITSGIPLLNTLQQFFVDDAIAARAGNDNQTLQNNPNALSIENDFISDVQNNNSLIKNHNVNVSSGTDEISLNLNATYFDQEGVLLNSGFDRLTTRMTGEFKNDRLRVFSSIGISEENRQQEPFALLERAILQKPFQPAINSVAPINGRVDLGQAGGNLELLGSFTRELNNEDNRKTRGSNIALSIDYHIIPGLTYRANLGLNTFNFRRKFLSPQYLLFNVDGDFVPGASREDAILQENVIFSDRSTIENSISYDKYIGKHNFKALALTSYEVFNSSTINAGVIGLLSNDTDVLGAGEEGSTPTGFEDRQLLAGLLGRLQYNYDDRYLLSASFRRDGSSQFSSSDGLRFGNFFGISAGWNISEESFFENIDFVNNFKIRGSIAEVGNSRINSFLFVPTIESGVNFIFGEEEQLAIGQIGRRFVSPGIKWETKISRNIGLDLALFNNKLTFNADYYVNDREDLLLGEQLPPSAGVNNVRDGSFNQRIVNAGNLTNKGIELAMSYKTQYANGLKWSVTGTFTKNENEITDLNGTARGFSGGNPITTDITDPTTFLAEGFEAGAFFLWENDGVIKTDEQLQAYNLINPSANLGDIMYIDQLTVDTDGDGINDAADGVINDNDRVYAGSGQPEFEAGFNVSFDYKGFDLFVQNYVSYGSEIYNGSRLVAYASSRHLELLNQWTPQNPTSDIPAKNAGTYDDTVRGSSDFFLEDGSYWRIRNITLGYTLPSIKSVSKIRIYAAAQNPFTFTRYTGFDPEIGGDGIFTRGVDLSSYPVTRRFLMGLQVSF